MGKFASLLGDARKRAGYTSQQDFARVISIPQQTYASYESGRCFPKEEILCKIGVTLNVSIDSLLGLTEFTTKSKDKMSLNAKINCLKKNASEASESVERLLESINKLEGAL